MLINKNWLKEVRSGHHEGIEFGDFSDGYAGNGYLNMIYNHFALQNTTNTLKNESYSDWGNFRILKITIGFYDRI